MLFSNEEMKTAYEELIRKESPSGAILGAFIGSIPAACVYLLIEDIRIAAILLFLLPPLIVGVTAKFLGKTHKTKHRIPVGSIAVCLHITGCFYLELNPLYYLLTPLIFGISFVSARIHLNRVDEWALEFLPILEFNSDSDGNAKRTEEINARKEKQRLIEMERQSDVYFGIPSNLPKSYSEFRNLPTEAKGFYFYLGSDGIEVIEQFLQSEYVNQVERLVIGDSTYDLGSGLKYDKITEAVSKVNFANVKEFSLGASELFCNAHCVFGTIGDITNSFKGMPKLKDLYLGGAFELHKPLYFPELERLTIQLDDYYTCVNGGPIAQATLDNLLKSRFPKLKEVEIDLERFEEDKKYTFVDLFLSELQTPNLTQLEIYGSFKFGEFERINHLVKINNKQVNLTLAETKYE